MKNLHLLLPEHTYAKLRSEAERRGIPPTTLAREAVDAWLRQQLRNAMRDAIAAYASEMAGTLLDLDSDWESAAVKHLMKTQKRNGATFTGSILFP